MYLYYTLHYNTTSGSMLPMKFQWQYRRLFAYTLLDFQLFSANCQVSPEVAYYLHSWGMTEISTFVSQKHRLGHLENTLFSVSKIFLSGSKYPK